MATSIEAAANKPQGTDVLLAKAFNATGRVWRTAGAGTRDCWASARAVGQPTGVSIGGEGERGRLGKFFEALAETGLWIEADESPADNVLGRNV